MAHIHLLGLANDLAEPLAGVLRRLSHEVVVTDSLGRSLDDRSANIVFTAGDDPEYRETVVKLTEARPDTAVIVVNRYPENHRWLDALELGATDYCGAPFEPVQIDWLVSGALRGLSQALT
jgi:DNA-binding NarL/FixJ family response regulator